MAEVSDSDFNLLRASGDSDWMLCKEQTENERGAIDVPPDYLLQKADINQVERG